MRIKFKDRFGNQVSFEKKERVWAPLPGEPFFETACRIYYPSVYRKIQKIRLEQETILARRAGGEAVLS